MTDSTDNTSKTKPNHPNQVVSSLTADDELDDQDAIDKLLVDTGFEHDQEYDVLEDFFDFGDFVEPVFKDILIEERPEPVVDSVDADDELTDQDAIDKLLVDSGFDAESVLQSESQKPEDDFFGLDDFSDFAEPVLEILPIKEELAVDSIDADDELVGQDAIDKLLVDSGFDAESVLQSESQKPEDDFFGLDDFSDFAEPVLEISPIKEELAVDSIDADDKELSDQEDAIDKLLVDSGFDNSPERQIENVDQVDDFSDFDDFAEPILEPISSDEDLAPEFDLPASADKDDIDQLQSGIEIDANNDELDPVMVDEFADNPVLDSFDEEQLTENNLVELMTTPPEPRLEADEDALIASQPALMGMEGDVFLALDEIGDDLFDESVESEMPVNDEFAELPSGRNSDTEEDFLLADFDITAGTDFAALDSATEGLDEFTDSDFNLPPEPIMSEAKVVVPELELELDEEINPQQLNAAESAVVTNSADNEALAKLKAEQERMDKQYKKQITEADAKAKKAAIFGYIALAVGVVALGLAGGMGWLAYSAKSQLSQLSESMAADNGSVQKSDQDLTAVKTSVEQLNQKVDGVIDQLKASPVPVLQTPNINTGHASKVHEEVAAQKDVINKSLDVSTTHIADLELPKPPQQNSQPIVADHLGNKAVEQTEKSDTTNKLPSKAAASSEPLPENKIAPTKNLTAKKKPPKIIKPAVEKVQSTNAHWSVNLIAFKQDWYAKSKAAEFAQKGVPVEVIPVDLNGVVWYRLRVAGFKNRAEADSYASRVKKALNLSSVWVGDI